MATFEDYYNHTLGDGPFDGYVHENFHNEVLADAVADGIHKYARALPLFSSNISESTTAMKRSLTNIAVMAGVNPYTGAGDSSSLPIPTWNQIENVFNEYTDQYATSFNETLVNQIESIKYLDYISPVKRSMVQDHIVSYLGNLAVQPGKLAQNAIYSMSPRIVELADALFPSADSSKLFGSLGYGQNFGASSGLGNLGTQAINKLTSVGASPITIAGDTMVGLLSYVDSGMNYFNSLMTSGIDDTFATFDGLITFAANELVGYGGSQLFNNISVPLLEDGVQLMQGFIGTNNLSGFFDGAGNLNLNFNSILGGMEAIPQGLISNILDSSLMPNLTGMLEDLTGGMMENLTGMLDGIMNNTGINSMLGMLGTMFGGTQEDSWGRTGPKGEKGSKKLDYEFF